MREDNIERLCVDVKLAFSCAWWPRALAGREAHCSSVVFCLGVNARVLLVPKTDHIRRRTLLETLDSTIGFGFGLCAPGWWNRAQLPSMVSGQRETTAAYLYCLRHSLFEPRGRVFMCGTVPNIYFGHFQRDPSPGDPFPVHLSLAMPLSRRSRRESMHAHRKSVNCRSATWCPPLQSIQMLQI